MDEKIPYELQNYIHRRTGEICDSNNADHRPTHQSEIDRMIQESLELYKAGETLVQSLTTEEKKHCSQLFRRKSEYREYELVRVRLLGKWVIVQNYIRYIEEARELAKIFAK